MSTPDASYFEPLLAHFHKLMDAYQLREDAAGIFIMEEYLDLRSIEKAELAE